MKQTPAWFLMLIVGLGFATLRARADWPWDGQCIPTHSTPVFAATAYHLQSRVLIIQFRNQTFYRYRDVPPDVYERLLASDFKGREFHRMIRGKFPTERLDRTDWPEASRPRTPAACPAAITTLSPEQANLFLLHPNPNPTGEKP